MQLPIRSSIVSIALFSTIFEIFDEIWVRCHSFCELMHDLYIDEIYGSGSNLLYHWQYGYIYSV